MGSWPKGDPLYTYFDNSTGIEINDGRTYLVTQRRSQGEQADFDLSLFLVLSIFILATPKTRETVTVSALSKEIQEKHGENFNTRRTWCQSTASRRKGNAIALSADLFAPADVNDCIESSFLPIIPTRVAVYIPPVLFYTVYIQAPSIR